MLLLVGLGNPGASYAGHRHNVGFMALDRIAAVHGFGPWRRKFQGDLADGALGGTRTLGLKPMTYMNRSGDAVAAAAQFYKLEPTDVLVIHDELDLAAGKIRVKGGGGDAGHNGLRSITAAIGKDYRRLRIGIGHPGLKHLVAGYALHDFAKDELQWLDPLLGAIAENAGLLAAGDDAGFQNKIALKTQPQRAGKPSPSSEDS